MPHPISEREDGASWEGRKEPRERSHVMRDESVAGLEGASFSFFILSNFFQLRGGGRVKVGLELCFPLWSLRGGNVSARTRWADEDLDRRKQEGKRGERKAETGSNWGGSDATGVHGAEKAGTGDGTDTHRYPLVASVFSVYSLESPWCA